MSNVNEDEDAYEAEDKGAEIFTISGTKIALSQIIPEHYFTSMNYDTFVAYAENAAEDFRRQFKDAAIDQWFQHQPLYKSPEDKDNEG